MATLNPRNNLLCITDVYILGINAYHGDAAAAITYEGKLIAAVEEERFNRRKHCAGFPIESIKYCLAAAGVSIDSVQHVGISRNPSSHLHRKILFAAKQVTNAERWTNRNSHSKKIQSHIFRSAKQRLRNAARIADLQTILER